MQSDLCQTFHINHQDFCSKKIVATFFVYGNNTNNYLHHSQPQKSPKTTEANRKKIIKFQPCPAPPPYLHTSPYKIYSIRYIEWSFKFILEVGVEDSIVNALRITDQLFKSNLTFCVVCVFTMQTDEWCVHNRLFSANFEDKFE
jgi:hypothetical protein